MRFLVLALAALIPVSSALAQTCLGPQGLPRPGAPVPLAPGEFRYSTDQGLGCAVAPDHGGAMAEHKKPVTFLPCLRVGAVAVSARRSEVEKLLGDPDGAQDQGLFTETRIYQVKQPGTLRPHYVVTYYDDRVVAAQLVGPPMTIPAFFSGLTLGDPIQKVIDTLGPPDKRCSARNGGVEMWTWAAFPIAVDVIEGYAAGFKVTWPEGHK
jgi:hypothetical protein